MEIILMEIIVTANNTVVAMERRAASVSTKLGGESMNCYRSVTKMISFVFCHISYFPLANTPGKANKNILHFFLLLRVNSLISAALCWSVGVVL